MYSKRVPRVRIPVSPRNAKHNERCTFVQRFCVYACRRRKLACVRRWVQTQKGTLRPVHLCFAPGDKGKRPRSGLIPLPPLSQRNQSFRLRIFAPMAISRNLGPLFQPQVIKTRHRSHLKAHSYNLDSQCQNQKSFVYLFCPESHRNDGDRGWRFMTKHYYHLFANGDDAKNFITEEVEFKAAFNRIAVCAYICKIDVLAASIEDSHPHFLLKGDPDSVQLFATKYVDLSNRYLARHRGSTEGVVLSIEICEINDEQYLMNAASYVIIQATKDGKAILPYDYMYGTGALYFRPAGTILPWDHNYQGNLYPRCKLSTFTVQEQWKICNTKVPMPPDWIIVNGFIHPINYIDIDGFERIFKTHNCFRAFMSSGRSRDEIVRKTMLNTRGITVEDIEARNLCREQCIILFGKQTIRQLTTEQRIRLSQVLRKTYLLSYRQLSTLTRIPESEIRKYIK